MKFVELCHIEGIKGIVRINENEYQSNMAVQESKLASILLRSTQKKVVELQQHVFNNLWKTAIPAEQRIKEIERAAEDSGSKESHKTMQLWTNQDQDQYAIRLEGNSELLATTNQNAQYTDLVKHSDYLEELEYDWDYTLHHWIKNNTDSDSFVHLVSGSIIETQLITDKKSGGVDKKNIGSRPSRLKCNICNLEFDDSKRRHEHEQLWHASNAP